ncbi:DUF2019 domain-containing protein [Aquabacter spiritensis]|uniref:Uncharacterized protein DUF2019 n=1 Tax=Aquabacter spiritensis TaxID=933073 RepID=A0A4R3LRU4_9HYPH|nr:DUF2019 domain-containing protein [Aquabacter spiritensis]TCT02359.1 uncharacterized protein DUF2019 [Aquabacter spiritensis]
MKEKALNDMTEEEIVDEFTSLAVRQKEASEKDRFSIYNKLYARVVELGRELKSRPGDRRRDLLPLLAHDNVQVRFMAAREVLAVAPEAACRTLQEIKDSNWFPFAADAGTTLSAFKSGVFPRPDP